MFICPAWTQKAVLAVESNLTFRVAKDSENLDTVLDLPWNKSSKDKIVISKVQKALDKTHYGLDKVKKRIIEQLAVRVLSEKQKGQIICLAGPPGVGKTSIAQSIAKSNRQ